MVYVKSYGFLANPCMAHDIGESDGKTFYLSMEPGGCQSNLMAFATNPLLG